MSSRKRRILVVDDNADLRLSLRLALELAGYVVAVAANGREALAAQNLEPADIVLTDIFMPEADGFEMIGRLRAQYPRTAILVMSGGAERMKQEYLSTARLLGVHATLRKPVEIDALLKILESLDPQPSDSH